MPIQYWNTVALHKSRVCQASATTVPWQISKTFHKCCNRSIDTCIITCGASPCLFCILKTRANSAQCKIRRNKVSAPFFSSAYQSELYKACSLLPKALGPTYPNPLRIFFALMQVWRCAVARNFRVTRRAYSAAAKCPRVA